MTKVMMDIDKRNNIMFDCQNHAEDHDACTIMSTLCNVLVEACVRDNDDYRLFLDGEEVRPNGSDYIDGSNCEHVRFLNDSYDINIVKGNVRIDFHMAYDDTVEVFETVMAVMKKAAIKQPEFIKIY